MTLVYIFIYFSSILVFSNILYTSLEIYFSEEKEVELKRYSNYISRDIEANGYLHNGSGELKDDLDNISDIYNIRVMVLDYQGSVIYDTQRVENNKLLVNEEIVKALSDKESIKYVQDVVNVFTPISNKTGAVDGVVIVSSSLKDIYAMITVIQDIIFNLLIIIGIIVAILYIYFTGVFVKPLHELLKAIKNISKGHLDEKVDIKKNDEFAELGKAFNQMTDRLYDIDQSRSEFVSNVSHELKTPLSSIKVLTESLLLQDNVPEELYKEFLNDINNEIDRQTAIINDLLTLVRLDEKEKVLNITKLNLNELVEKILKRLQPLAENRNIDLIFETNRQVEADIDEMKITLAISNLIENGIKYNRDRGKVIVTLDAGHDEAFITVTDTGIGIPEDHFDKLFQRFYRVDKTRDRATGGTGLGLSIAHRSILLHKGSISLDSEEGIGTRFYVTIPLRRQKV
ncbi:sensor histidine kinase [Vallitalea okinawensis]|uniref:sensor histidine kinase n=1 Tax=Vallitalea okinawensis TaxID=2078660 RepID=UPI001300984C|nr:HAMP domain-containing sensor histidine kinase [Vallitalea okinawensis]